MTPGRIVFIIILVVLTALWGLMRRAEADLSNVTREIVREAMNEQQAYQEAPTPAAQDRMRRAKSEFFTRYRSPEGDQHQQNLMLDALWRVLITCDPPSAHYADDGPSPGGRPAVHRVVRIRSTSGGETGFATLVLYWGRYGGKWCIEGFQVQGGDPG